MKIKKTVISILAIIFLSYCSKKYQESGFIKADISKLSTSFDKAVINMWGYEFLGDSIRISDTVQAKNGKFEFHYKIKEPKHVNIFLLKNNKRFAEIGFRDKSFEKRKFWGDIYLGNENVLFNSDSIYEIKEGRGLKYFNVDFEGSSEAEMYMKTFKEIVVSNENIKKQPSSFALFEQLFRIRDNLSINQLKDYSSLFSEDVKKSTSFDIFQSYIVSRENIEEHGYRKNFNWVDINNKSYNFEQVQRGKLVLLVFWGSWCGPCRKEIPQLKLFYNNYRDKVSIVSLSIDDNYEKWKDAVEKEKMPWVNLSGLPKNKNGIKKEYNISTVPNLILLDGNGKGMLNVNNDLPKVIELIKGSGGD